MAVSVKRVPGPGRKALEVLIKGMDGLEGRVGWDKSAKYEDGTPVAKIAVVQEFGVPAKNIPPRSFFRTTILERNKAWRAQMLEYSKAMLDGKAVPEDVMNRFLLGVTGDVLKKISQIWTPPLAPATIKARIRRRADYQRLSTRTGRRAKMSRAMSNIVAGRQVSIAKPLKDTGHMIDTLTHKVGKE